MDTTWIIVADNSRARLFERHGVHGHPSEIEDLVNPGGRLADSDLRSDERGRFYGKGERYQGHTAEPNVFPVEHENEMFAAYVAHYLEQARSQQRYRRLYLIAAPKFLGLLRSKLNKEVQKLVLQELPKDLSGLAPAQIESYLKDKLVSPPL